MDKLKRKDFRDKNLPKANIKFEFQGLEIEVIPYISLEDEITFVRNYVETIYTGIESRTDVHIADNFITAEYAFIVGVLDKCTNIDIEYNPKSKDNVDINAIIGSGLWNKIKESIDNYYDVEGKLWNIVEQIEHKDMINNSVGKVLKDVSGQFIELLKVISTTNPEDFAKTVQSFSEKLEELNTSVPGIFTK